MKCLQLHRRHGNALLVPFMQNGEEKQVKFIGCRHGNGSCLFQYFTNLSREKLITNGNGRSQVRHEVARKSEVKTSELVFKLVANPSRRSE